MVTAAIIFFFALGALCFAFAFAVGDNADARALAGILIYPGYFFVAVAAVLFLLRWVL